MFEVPEIVLPDLKGYKREAKFKREVNKFFKYWDIVVASKSTKKSQIPKMEAFFGEVLDKFTELTNTKQRRVFTTEYPFKLIAGLTNLKIPLVFDNSEDNLAFKDIFLTHVF